MTGTNVSVKSELCSSNMKLTPPALSCSIPRDFVEETPHKRPIASRDVCWKFSRESDSCSRQPFCKTPAAPLSTSAPSLATHKTPREHAHFLSGTGLCSSYVELPVSRMSGFWQFGVRLRFGPWPNSFFLAVCPVWNACSLHRHAKLASASTCAFHFWKPCVSEPTCRKRALVTYHKGPLRDATEGGGGWRRGFAVGREAKGFVRLRSLKHIHADAAGVLTSRASPHQEQIGQRGTQSRAPARTTKQTTDKPQPKLTLYCLPHLASTCARNRHVQAFCCVPLTTRRRRTHHFAAKSFLLKASKRNTGSSRACIAARHTAVASRI